MVENEHLAILRQQLSKKFNLSPKQIPSAAQPCAIDMLDDRIQ